MLRLQLMGLVARWVAESEDDHKSNEEQSGFWACAEDLRELLEASVVASEDGTERD